MSGISLFCDVNKAAILSLCLEFAPPTATGWVRLVTSGVVSDPMRLHVQVYKSVAV